MDRVDTYRITLFGTMQGRGFGENAHAALAVVVSRYTGFAHHALDGRDVDDGAAALLHHGNGCAGSQEHTLAVDRLGGAPVIQRSIFYTAYQRDSGIVYQHVQRAVAGHNVLYHIFPQGLIGHILEPRLCLAAIGIDLFSYSLCSLDIDVGNDHHSTLFGKAPGSGFADTGAGAGDQGNFIL